MLTKSDLQSFLQCPRKLWLERTKPELLPKEQSGYSRRAMDGVIVGQKAREQLGRDYLWPKAGEDEDGAAAHAFKELAAAPDKPAAEVPMVHADLYARADALIPSGGRYILRETKASTFPLKEDKQTPGAPKDHFADGHQGISFYEGVVLVKPPAAAVVVYEALFNFVPPSSLRVGWPGPFHSTSANRSSPPSIRGGMRCRTPDAVCAQAGKANQFWTKRPIYRDGHA